jgi:hypothetical protein
MRVENGGQRNSLVAMIEYVRNESLPWIMNCKRKRQEEPFRATQNFYKMRQVSGLAPFGGSREAGLL